MARELKVIGLMNVQYAVKGETVYVLEVNPRASRTVPFVSKAIGKPLAKLAAKVMAGKTLKELNFTEEIWPKYWAVKESVFPFNKFVGQDILLSPEMRSTAKSWASTPISAWPTRNRRWRQTRRCLRAGKFSSASATRTKRKSQRWPNHFPTWALNSSPRAARRRFWKSRLKVQRILKLLEGRPNVIDLIKNKEIQLVINTPAGQSPREDEVKIRTTAVYTGTPIMTTLSGAKAAALGIAALKKSGYAVKTIQEYH
jgi:carbamoyl-phosphate synthase large subunit